ncbi:Tankyrase-1-like [Oopsacas minuta]|uniref:Tankyrase-1-like n=1 Tax=Oopsacas minuta TaxID=111878 RepID=A0AAV7JW96_9METZ|nr:Tankyrase-1-like [Oopsacas minuta]
MNVSEDNDESATNTLKKINTTPVTNDLPVSSDTTPEHDVTILPSIQPQRLPLTLETPSADTLGKSKNSALELQLFEASRRGEMTKIQKLVSQQIDINAKDMNGRKSTALHFAAGFGRRDTVECLLSNGAQVNTKDDGGLIALHNACSFGHVEVVTCLLEHGADPNSRDKWGYTPLHEASNKGKRLFSALHDVHLFKNISMTTSKYSWSSLIVHQWQWGPKRAIREDLLMLISRVKRSP